MPNDPFFARDPWGGYWGGGWYASTPQGGIPWWLGPTDPLWGILMPQPNLGGLEPRGFDPWTIIGGGSPLPPGSWRTALESVGALVDEIPPDVRSQLDYIWDLTRSLRAILDLLAARQLLRGYYDPDTGEWRQPHYSVTVTTTEPSGSATPPEKPEPRPEAGIIDWTWDPGVGQWIPVFSVTAYTSLPQTSATQPTTTREEPTTTIIGEPSTTTTEPSGIGWIYDPLWDVYIPIPGITFVVTATTTTPDVEYHTSPITTVLTPGTTTPWPPFIFTTTWEGITTTDTTTTETTTTETTATDTTTTAVGGGGGGAPGVAGRISGAGAPMPGPPAPVVGRPLGESVWQLAQYIPALVPHLGYFLAGR
jgi:hypothetical protein